MGIVLMPASKHTSQILLLCINKFRYIIRATSDTSDWYTTSRCCLYCSCCYRLEMMTSELCLKTLDLPTSCAFTSEWTSPSWVDPLFCDFQICKCSTPEVTWWHDVQAPLLSPIFCPPPPPQPEIWKLYKMDSVAYKTQLKIYLVRVWCVFIAWPWNYENTSVSNIIKSPSLPMITLPLRSVQRKMPTITRPSDIST